MGIVAKIVWDGGDKIVIPEELGKPKADQLQGTVREQLVELAGRACYDSLGVGRSSVDYHKHIQEVGHLSVLEHAFATIQLADWIDPMVFLNRPGIWVEYENTAKGCRITFNPRSVIEWEAWEKGRPLGARTGDFATGQILKYHASKLYPKILTSPVTYGPAIRFCESIATVVNPETDDEKWVSMFMGMSRGCSHELVRHGDFTAISQRCLAGDTEIVVVNGKNRAMPRTHKNQPARTIKWLYERMQDPRLRRVVGKLKVRVLDEKTGLFTSSKFREVVYSGRKPCFKVHLRDGYHITCSEDHRIWTRDGWKTLKEITAPYVTDGGVVVWNRGSSLEVGVNGTHVIGNGKYLDRQWMQEKFEAGLSDEEIAKECGAKPGTIIQHRTRMGFKKRELGDFSHSPIRDKEWLMKHYRELSLTQSQIAELAKCSVAAVHNWVRKHGIQKKISEINLGRIPWNKGISYSHTQPYSPESIERYRVSKTGERNPRWKGGVSGSAARRAFHAWKRANGKMVFERDGYRCRICDRRAHEVPTNSRHMRKRSVEIHHIIPVWNRPDLSCDPGNMATVCWECQAKKLNGHELEYAPMLLKAIQSSIPYEPSSRQRPYTPRRVKVQFKEIEAITFAGIVDTYDLMLDGPNHGFVGNGVVVHNSTRFVNESESEWIDHPLVREFDKAYAQETSVSNATDFMERIWSVRDLAKKVYSEVVDKLQAWLTERGVDKLTARKQARGAARGYLGNALYTEMIFSANIAQWKRMLRLRCSAPADAEIRILFGEALAALKASRYGPFFNDFELVDSPDGIGKIAVEKK